jgi:hypothetical protein
MLTSLLLLANGKTRKPQAHGKAYPLRTSRCDRATAFTPHSQSPMNARQESRRIGMTKQEDNLARERKEIAARVASFKATQEKFRREREEYFVTTLENARNGTDGKSHWS